MLFDSRPDSIVVTTALYEGQGPDWWYLTPDSGQHVFFYTRKAMKIIAERFGYTACITGHYTIFTRKRLGRLKMMAAKGLMSSVGTRLLRSAIMLLPARGAVSDFKRIASRKAG